MAKESIRLFHFTSVQHLPGILDKGYIKEGDTPFGANYRDVMAVNLTTSPNPKRMGLGGATDKEAVRISIVLPIDSPKLLSFQQCVEKFKPSGSVFKAMTNPRSYAVDTWYCYFGKIDLFSISAIEIKSSGRYIPLQPWTVDEALKLVPLDKKSREQLRELTGLEVVRDG